MKGNKYKIIALTLIILCLSVIPVYAAWSINGVSNFTNTGSYVGGYSYTSGSECTSVNVYSDLYAESTRMDEDYDSQMGNWAQADVGHNNDYSIDWWNIYGTHYGYKAGVSGYKYDTSADYFAQ